MVEIMCPLFSKYALRKCVETFMTQNLDGAWTQFGLNNWVLLTTELQFWIW